MLTYKLVSSGKSSAKAATKSVTKKSAVRVVAPDTAVATKRVSAQNMAVYATREKRMSRERSKFSGLLIQKSSASDFEVAKLVHNRLSVGVIDRLLAEGVTKQEVSLVAPLRTLAHRRAKSERLTVDESDRAVRLARVIAQVESVFDNKEKAMSWLRYPMKRFEGKTPIEMLATDVGSRLVEEALVQIDEGYFA